jgi:hypothetical protein
MPTFSKLPVTLLVATATTPKIDGTDHDHDTTKQLISSITTYLLVSLFNRLFGRLQLQSSSFKMKEAQVMLRWFFGPVLLFLVACRTRVRLANCLTMLTWSIEIGHGAEGPLRSGCVNEMMTMKSKHGSGSEGEEEDDSSSKDNQYFIDVSDITMTPAELEAIFLQEQQQQHVISNNEHNGIGNTNIPRILHQSYISTQIHSALYPFVQSWHEGLSSSSSTTPSKDETKKKKQKSDWKFVWWTDEDIRWLVHTHYPSFVKVWEGLPHTIMKADTARYFILHRYGGFYADMDIEYLHKNEPSSTTTTTATTTTTTTTTMGLEDWFQQYGKDATTQEEYNAYVFHECADNSMMASTANATFWPIVFTEWTKKANNPFYQTVNRISGIDMLKDICDSRDQMLVPVGVRLSTPDNRMFAYHHGTNTWRWKTKRDDIVRICDVIILVHLSIFALIVALQQWCHVDLVRYVTSFFFAVVGSKSHDKKQLQRLV